jgi:putative ubiquitin-RnfH superfamily antitoxin RatB of RatAB toxin-antitoxin module
MSTDTEPGAGHINVEVAYALPQRQWLLKIEVPRGSTALQAIDICGIREAFPSIEVNEVGIFSRKVPLDHVLSEGDRIEIYRSLIVSPREMRRQRARGEKPSA